MKGVVKVEVEVKVQVTVRGEVLSVVWECRAELAGAESKRGGAGRRARQASRLVIGACWPDNISSC